MAIDLRVGDLFWQRDGGQVAVEEVSVEFKTETIYNFEVATHHNYAIGNHGYLVHNANQRWDKMKDAVRSGFGKTTQSSSNNVIGRRGAFRSAKRDAGIARSQQPDSVISVPMTDRRGKAILGADGKPIMSRHYTFTRSDGSKVIIQDHSAGRRGAKFD